MTSEGVHHLIMLLQSGSANADEEQALREAIAELSKEPTLLICVNCHNTESPAGAMARTFNHGRCAFCGGYFRVYRA